MGLSEADAVFLRAARIARLATASPAGEPHVIPVCFVLGGDAIYSAIDAKPKRAAPRLLRRVRNIAANPRAMLVVDSYDEDWTRLRYVLVSGRTDILETGPEWERALELLREKYPQYRTMPTFSISLVIRLQVEHVVSWPELPTG